MKNILILILAFFTLTCLNAEAEGNLSREEQLELIGYYKFIYEGRGGIPADAQSLFNFDSIQLPLKCGTPSMLSYAMNFGKFDKDLVDRLGLAVPTRPTVTTESYNPPGGHFKIHYTRTGGHAVYQASQTTGGIPNYVLGVGRIFDSVWMHIVDTLGFPVPPTDGFYPSGGDSLYDVYLVNLNGTVYGLTYPDSSSGFSIVSTSFIVIDNDYQESVFPAYNSNPLNAVRVTTAHEFFHAIHFAIDKSEMENYCDCPDQRPYWFEMSATWMEEEIYDDINDYYITLPYFFNFPRASIQQFNGGSDFHPYASCVFPIFLTEKFGRDIIRPIWLKCGQMGFGPNFLEAAQLVIDSVSKSRCAINPTDPVCDSSANFRSVFGEFTLWNYFTGSRAASAPPNVGYSEKEFYPAIPESAFTILDDYPASETINSNPKNPTPNSAAYFKLNNTRAVFYTNATDTNFRVALILGDGADSTLPQGWHIKQINQSDLFSNQYSYSGATFGDDTSPFVFIANPRQYRSVTFVLAPASWRWEPYTNTDWDSRYGYIITDSLDVSLIDTNLTIDSSALNVEPAVLSAYPNPAVLSQMGSQNLRFRFNIPTDSISFAPYSSPYCEVDIYTLAGELIKTCDTVGNPNQNPNPYIRTVLFEIDWDMKSETGSHVSSGVYICVGRLFSDSNRGELLAEEKAKVLIVR